MKIQSMQSLKKEMLSVARGKSKAPADAAQISFESEEAVIRLSAQVDRRKMAGDQGESDTKVVKHIGESAH